jgi:mono/diheme cytochrome c family protein
MCHPKFVSMLGIIWCVSFSLFAQGKPQADTATPAVTPVTVGQEMFRAYCTSCHGLDGKGNGPAASALKNKPPDLTQLSKTNGGKFPSARVESVIQGDQFIAAHGSREMPIWGEAFRNVNRDEALAKLKVHNLTVYIESMQQK